MLRALHPNLPVPSARTTSLQVSSSQGIAGFYRGLPAALFGSILSSSVYFGTYELSKGFLSHPHSLSLSLAHAANLLSLLPPQLQPSVSLRSVSFTCPAPLIPPVAAALGNLASSAVLVPKEFVKQQLQVSWGTYALLCIAEGIVCMRGWLCDAAAAAAVLQEL